NVKASLEARGVFCRQLDVSVPFHSFLMDPIREDFVTRLGNVETARGSIPFYSTVRGRRTDEPLCGDYWWGNIREPVRYQQALRALVGAGLGCFLEIGPHPALLHGSVETLRAMRSRGTFVPTLRREGDDPLEIARAISHALALGAREKTEKTEE